MLKFDINEFGKVYFVGLIMFCGLIIVQLFVWMQNYNMIFGDCVYCQSFEIQRKLHDFLGFLPIWNLILLPIALTFGVIK